ncbi:AAA family ATPase [Dethiosulfovibrio sp. F2B]|uniref:DNA repair protein RecN n=1 Tax=Dethiosulfovibrio faecalis TaxID=2720018 RepID=UPI001F1AEA66|nr:AAA family ATPase [Dethiosulfovibrio faecalis]MCF4150509.1 AAA family ATPase [Dethiosulfovibrio faecalis]
MIEELHIRHIGGIRESHLRFSSGLTAITGESGAGKSSVVRALELASGKRASSSMIRSDSDSADVEAVYLFDEEAPDFLYGSEDGRLFVRREIVKNGRGKVLLQNRQAPVGALSEVSQKLITIQSQFAQLELLDQDKQLFILDLCGGDSLKKLRGSLKDQVKATISIEKELQSLRQRQRSITDRFKSAEEVVHRWRKMDISEESEALWEEEYRRLSEELERLNDLRKIVIRMKNDEPGSVKEELDDLIQRLSQLLPRKRCDDLSPHMEAIVEGYGALLNELESDSDEDRRSAIEESVEELESKIGHLRKLKRAAGVTSLKDLILYCREADQELDWLSKSNDLRQVLEKDVEEHRKTASRMALELRKLRKKAALWLEARVNRCLNEMAMEDARFSVGLIEERKLRPNGADSVEFRLSWGRNEPGPVSKMASGGELSRILLAIRLSLPEEDRPPTVVFDEVEAGLGGRAAVLAGLKLRDLSRRCQVIMVTHEASIAALADVHLVVKRDGMDSEISELEDEERISEIARMLSGDLDMDEARSHAFMLLRRGESPTSTE